MVIAVNTSFIESDFTHSNFILECFVKIAEQQPLHQFIYIFDSAFDERYITSKNITPVIAGPKSKNPLLLQYRLLYKIPALLRKYNVDVLVSNSSVGCLRTKVPQCIIVNDLFFLQQPHFYKSKWLNFYKKNTVKNVAKAKAIITTSLFLKNQIVTTYAVSEDKIDVAYAAASNNFIPATWQQKDAIKDTYTEGLEYFLYSGPIDFNSNLITLLKAFSFFKKRQKSNMQLVLASKNKNIDTSLIKSLASFKYRDEVKILDCLPEPLLATITASAYAVIYPLLYGGAATTTIEAMQTGVPVITTTATAMPEICGDAALYINADDFNDIADKMMLLFKDENKRNELINKGSQQAILFNWDKTEAAVWKAINKCINSLN